MVRADEVTKQTTVLGQEGALKFLAMQEWTKIAQSSMQNVNKASRDAVVVVILCVVRWVCLSPLGQVVYMPFDSKTNPVSFGASPFPFLEDQLGKK
jgi:hypothetical protein